MVMNEILLIVLIVLLVVNIYLTSKAKSSLSQGNLDDSFKKLEEAVRDEFSRNRDETNRNSKETREELSNSFHTFDQSIGSEMARIAAMQKDQLDTFSNQLTSLTNKNEERFEKLTQKLDIKLDSFQEKMASNAKDSRDDLAKSLKSFEDQFKSSVIDFNDLQKQNFADLKKEQKEMLATTEKRLTEMRELVERKLDSIQKDNSEKLEQMRQTVDEKLHKALEERLGESFKIVSDRLEQVHRGLGEMQSLANGVGDLKKVLSNVRTRGSLGEYRLEMILEQILAPELYQKNVATKQGSRENVEFAIKIPSKDSENEIIWLPIDSKFPQDRYQALLDAYESGDIGLIEEAVKELDKTIKSLAKDIRDKYINPPFTTDFAIMFLPFEGLYAEVVKRPSLFETLQKDFKINVTGPSTLAAFVHSLQMGFRTLAIQKRSSEVWGLLGAVRTEFGKFGTFLEGVQKNLEIATEKIHKASQKSRTIERKLRNVEALPQQEVVKYLDESSDSEIEDEADSQEHPTT